MNPPTGDPDNSKAPGTDGDANGAVEPRTVRISRRRGEDDANGPIEPELNETIRGSKPGSRFVRITRNPKLRRVRPGEYAATREVLEADTRIGRFWDNLRGFFIGKPLASSELSHERLSKTKALAIFSSDNLSSSAYATEEMLLVLILAGTAALNLALPVAIAIACLAAIVATSYVQLVKAYPGGGGAYAVTKENLGVNVSLLTGSTLFVDYVLTVAVSTAAGVAAITSALPELSDLRPEMAVAFVTILTIVNLRGIRESGSVFAIPPYLFILGFGSMIVVGIVRLALGHDLQPSAAGDAFEAGTQGVTVLLVLRAFSSGAAALTGIEAIADGVPSFKSPEATNASRTLIAMALILSSLFVGITFLATQLDIVPAHDKTVVAQIASAVFGEGIIFYFIQIVTALILVLAANTAFAGLPTLASVMAKDRVMPTQFAFRGDRLAFSNGIIVLGLLSVGVLIAFNADTHKIVPLYAFGVFMAFTLSQAGMVIHWRRARTPGWRRALAINAFGAAVTAVVAVIVGATKFSHGAWLSMLAMALLFVVLARIKAHYDDATRQLGRGLENDGGRYR